MRPQRIVALVPAYNEAGKIGMVVNGVKDRVNEVIVIDDGSTDKTSEEAAAAGATVLHHKKNQGVGAAFRTGCRHARETGAHVIVFMAGDGQSDPEDLDRLVMPIVQGEFDFVQGSRFLVGADAMPRFRRFGNMLLTRIFTLLVGSHVTDYTSGYRAISVQGLQKIELPDNGFDRYEMEPWILIQCTKKLRWKEVSIRTIYGRRTRDTSKMKPVIDWIRFLPPIFRYLKKTARWKLSRILGLSGRPGKYHS